MLPINKKSPISVNRIEIHGKGGWGRKKLCPNLEVMMDLEWFRWQAYQERSVEPFEPVLSLCEAFVKLKYLTLLISFNLFSFFSHQEAKRTSSFLMNLSQDRKVSFIFFSITLPYVFHFRVWGSAEHSALLCQSQSHCGFLSILFLDIQSIFIPKKPDVMIFLGSHHFLTFPGLFSPVHSYWYRKFISLQNWCSFSRFTAKLLHGKPLSFCFVCDMCHCPGQTNIWKGNWKWERIHLV